MAQESGGAANRLIPVTSRELADVIAVMGMARILPEEPFTEEGSTAPSLYQRRFELTDIEAVHGDAPTDKSITFHGYTLLSSNQRYLDTRMPELHLDGQDFFEGSFSSDTVPTLLLIGGPELDSIGGFMGNSAAVDGGSLDGQPVRAYDLEGANADLADSFPMLLGWQSHMAMETVESAAEAAHPLVGVDALRIAVKDGNVEQTEYLSRWLLHPSEPVSVQTEAIGLLGIALSKTSPGSDDANRLLMVAAEGWEGTGAFPTGAAYLRMLQSAAAQIRASDQRDRVSAVLDDYRLTELYTLAQQLAESLGK